jgi:hypothetical protein
MVGGTLIELVYLDDMKLLRLWVIDPKTYDEMLVYAKPAASTPKVYDNVWWQGSKIYFNNDKSYLVKVGSATFIKLSYLSKADLKKVV